MKTVQVEFMERVQNGEPFMIDLEKKTMRVGNTYLIKEGVHDNERKLLDKNEFINDYNIMDVLETMYAIYKYSYPSEAETKRKRNYFKALTADEMTDEQMVNGEDRTIARGLLEAFVLVSSLNGDLKWNPKWGSWYYQGKDKDFILLKKWIDN